jgi:hypothetical protein
MSFARRARPSGHPVCEQTDVQDELEMARPLLVAQVRGRHLSGMLTARECLARLLLVPWLLEKARAPSSHPGLRLRGPRSDLESRSDIRSGRNPGNRALLVKDDLVGDIDHREAPNWGCHINPSDHLLRKALH